MNKINPGFRRINKCHVGTANKPPTSMHHPHPAPTENFANSLYKPPFWDFFRPLRWLNCPSHMVLVGPMGWAVGFEFPGIHSDQNSDYWASV